MATKPHQQAKSPAVQKQAEAQQSLVLTHSQMPEYLAQRGQSSRGNEQVGVEDIIIPRLEIVQALSPCKKRNDPTFIEGAEDGMLYNNVTRELYGDEVLLMPIYFRKEWLVWVDRQKSDGSGGFRGAYATAELAAEKINELGEQDLQVIDTAQQFCLLVHSVGRTEEVVVSMARSKMKVSRRWNSLIRLAGGDRWSRVYKMTSTEEKGKKGTFYNYNVEMFGWPTQQLFHVAEQKYASISTGRVRADISGTSALDEDGEDGKRSGNDY